MGYDRIDCKCGKILMVERNSFGTTTILNKDELYKFLKDKELITNDKDL